ncbi:hypothetical protein H1S01_03435 [Heliobacterium chlorum]|uniref:Uncharacterized protein n=1 Tax=Heliobacterium chlorum TaxID=2698 RepID=A0ABR7T0V3_HELCL|nr:hypothetical protein [Heliobacterium chlorum]MBC9783565.1 hypothetical protein [Heliobacterium chlorum]
MTTKIVLGETDIKTTIRMMIAASGLTGLAELAREMGEKENTLRSAVNNGAIRLVDFQRAAEIMGFSVTIEQKEKPRSTE